MSGYRKLLPVKYHYYGRVALAASATGSRYYNPKKKILAVGIFNGQHSSAGSCQ